MSTNIARAPAFLIYFVYSSFLVTLFSGGMIIPVFVLCCIYVIWISRFQIRFTILKKPVFLTWLCFCVWITFSYFWSVSPADTLITLVKFWLITILGIAAILGIISIKSEGYKPINNVTLVAILSIISFILIAEHLSGYKLAVFLRKTFNFEIYNYGQPMDHATALYTLLLPLCFYQISKSKKLIFILFPISIIVYFLHPMFAALLAFIIACISCSIVLKFGRKLLLPLATCTILLLLFMPQLMHYFLNNESIQSFMSVMPLSWQERISIWNKSIELINIRSITGWGLDTSSLIEKMTSSSQFTSIQAHPHNIPLQLRLETGIIGVLIFCTFIFYLWRSIFDHQDRLFDVACVGGMTVYFVFAMVSFNNWHSWWLCTQYLAIIIILAFWKLNVKEQTD